MLVRNAFKFTVNCTNSIFMVHVVVYERILKNCYLSNFLILHVLSFEYLGNKGFILQCKVDWKFMACKDELNDMYMPKTILWILHFNVLF